jgi:hypothetical protein
LMGWGDVTRGGVDTFGGIRIIFRSRFPQGERRSVVSSSPTTSAHIFVRGTKVFDALHDTSAHLSECDKTPFFAMCEVWKHLLFQTRTSFLVRAMMGRTTRWTVARFAFAWRPTITRHSMHRRAKSSITPNELAPLWLVLFRFQRGARFTRSTDPHSSTKSRVNNSRFEHTKGSSIFPIRTPARSRPSIGLSCPPASS